MAGSEDLQGYLGAEIRAGLSTPLISRSGVLLGMISAYWREPHDIAPSEVHVLDVLTDSPPIRLSVHWRKKPCGEAKKVFAIWPTPYLS